MCSSDLSAIQELSLTRKEVGRIQKPSSLTVTEWSALWEQNLYAAATSLEDACGDLRQKLAAFAVAVGAGNQLDGSAESLQLYGRLAKELSATATENFAVIFHKELAQLFTHVDSLEASFSIVQQQATRLKGVYAPEVLTTIPVEDLDREWRVASTKFWPFSIMAKRRVKKLLQTYASSGSVDPEIGRAHV